ncbi:hypothetical protein WJX74_010781 [Apatococcus lobatus]|uniref:Uncharacterized protein n=1 Tax=Apatococcus lobatus TaxID=904363 RepID=A0AAW1SH51_9CHLO
MTGKVLGYGGLLLASAGLAVLGTVLHRRLERTTTPVSSGSALASVAVAPPAARAGPSFPTTPLSGTGTGAGTASTVVVGLAHKVAESENSASAMALLVPRFKAAFEAEGRLAPPPLVKVGEGGDFDFSGYSDKCTAAYGSTEGPWVLQAVLDTYGYRRPPPRQGP